MVLTQQPQENLEDMRVPKCHTEWHIKPHNSLDTLFWIQFTWRRKLNWSLQIIFQCPKFFSHPWKVIFNIFLCLKIIFLQVTICLSCFTTAMKRDTMTNTTYRTKNSERIVYSWGGRETKEGERETEEKGLTRKGMDGLLWPQNPPPVTHLQQGHTS